MEFFKGVLIGLGPSLLFWYLFLRGVSWLLGLYY
jgi:hypothetical protein